MPYAIYVMPEQTIYHTIPYHMPCQTYPNMHGSFSPSIPLEPYFPVAWFSDFRYSVSAVRVEKGSKSKAEEEMLEIIKGADLVVLARYMQVLSPDFIDPVGVPIVNIHHSFLPAFKGANPYRQAHEKGVRLIGATAHYVTPELDQGPIIEQDVARVNHRMSVQDFRAMGRSVECKVLHRAVKWHLEDRVFLVDGNKTVVFS